MESMKKHEVVAKKTTPAKTVTHDIVTLGQVSTTTLGVSGLYCEPYQGSSWIRPEGY